MKFYQVFIFFLGILFETKSESHKRVPRIIGGYQNVSLDLDLAKYIVSIRKGSDGGIYGSNHICAGTIISKRAILTASHCLLSRQKGMVINEQYLTIVAGIVDRLKPSKFERIYTVEKILRYPVFNTTTHVGDLAILKLDEDIKEDGVHIQRLDLIATKPATGEKCIVFGWGKILFNGPLADNLVYLNTTILPIKDCAYFAHISYGVVCAGVSYNQEKTAGPGDSGGPFVCNGKLAGVISFIVPIRTYFTSVWFYRDWILMNNARSNSFSLTFFIFILSFLISKFFW